MFSDIRSSVLVMCLGLATVVSSPCVASANGGTDHYVTAVPGTDGTSVVVGAGYSSSGGVSSGADQTSSPVQCTYPVLSGDLAAVMGTGPGGATDGVWVLPTCTGEGYVNPMRPVWVTNAPTTAPSAAAVARQAVARLSLPQGIVRMSPEASQRQLVGERTWLWIDPAAWKSMSATASAGPVSATATASPAQLVWNMGDGDRVTCNGPGRPYDPNTPDGQQDTSCSYVWPRSSASEPDGAFTASVTILWDVSWTAAGAEGGGSFGRLTGPPTEVTVAVTEGQSLNTAS